MHSIVSVTTLLAVSVTTLLAGILAAAAPVVESQMLPPTPEVHLEPHNGKTQFYLGEPIQLDLVFRNETGSPMMLNTTDYGDISETVTITPADGWIAWRGKSGHDFAAVTDLTETPVRVPVLLNDGYIFRKPGHYLVSVTTQRVSGGTMMNPTRMEGVTTNNVSIDLEPMPEKMENGMVQQILSELSSVPAGRAGSTARHHLMYRLATLQGDEALTEKIQRIVCGDEDFRQVYTLAMATTTNLQRQLDLLEAAWRNSANVPQYDMPDAMDVTRRLLAKMPLEGWQMVVAPRQPTAAEKKLVEAHRRDMEDLLASVPQRTGESRTMAAYFLMEFSGLSDTEKQQAHEYAVEEFPRMDPVAQGMLLQTANPPLRDPRLLPVLKENLTKNSLDRETVKAAVELASGDEQKSIVVQTVCASGYPVQLETLNAFHGDRLPEVDTCLTARLKAGSDANRFWGEYAILAARFATPAILPEIRSSYQPSRDMGAMLAVLMRMAPGEAARWIATEADFSVTDFFDAGRVYDSLQASYPDEVLTAIRSRIPTVAARQQASLAYQLSRHGSSNDEAILEKLLDGVRREWAGREKEVKDNTDWKSSAGRARSAENDLVSSLIGASAWSLSLSQKQEIIAGCMSDECRHYAAPQH